MKIVRTKWTHTFKGRPLCFIFSFSCFKSFFGNFSFCWIFRCYTSSRHLENFRYNNVRIDCGCEQSSMIQPNSLNWNMNWLFLRAYLVSIQWVYIIISGFDAPKIVFYASDSIAFLYVICIAMQMCLIIWLV